MAFEGRLRIRQRKDGPQFLVFKLDANYDPLHAEPIRILRVKFAIFFPESMLCCIIVSVVTTG
jgi:hypothetical protein